MKTNQSFSQRLKVTKNGKILRRALGQDHFNAKDSGRERTRKRKLVKTNFTNRVKRRFLPRQS